MKDSSQDDLIKTIDFLRTARKFQTTYRFTSMPDGDKVHSVNFKTRLLRSSQYL